MMLGDMCHNEYGNKRPLPHPRIEDLDSIHFLNIHKNINLYRNMPHKAFPGNYRPKERKEKKRQKEKK